HEVSSRADRYVIAGDFATCGVRCGGSRNPLAPSAQGQGRGGGNDLRSGGLGRSVIAFFINLPLIGARLGSICIVVVVAIRLVRVALAEIRPKDGLANALAPFGFPGCRNRILKV